jgi:hypothetical protein
MFVRRSHRKRRVDQLPTADQGPLKLRLAEPRERPEFEIELYRKSSSLLTVCICYLYFGAACVTRTRDSIITNEGGRGFESLPRTKYFTAPAIFGRRSIAHGDRANLQAAGGVQAPSNWFPSSPTPSATSALTHTEGSGSLSSLSSLSRIAGAGDVQAKGFGSAL